jgi:alpha-methylacyl-CoA racemase
MKVLEIAARLPGPLAGHFLTLENVEVTKLEDKNFPDPFSDTKTDPQFLTWYQQINKNKIIIKEDFSSFDLTKFCEGFDVLLISLPEKIKKLLKIHEINLPIVEIKSTHKDHPKHDLNFLMDSGLLSLQNYAMPALPFGAIEVSHRTALKTLVSLYQFKLHNKKEHQILYMQDVIDELMHTLWPNSIQNRNRFLHNGLYPCYNVYKTRDDRHIALAAVEEKFWVTFCEKFSLELSLDDRFDISGEVKTRIQKRLEALTLIEIKDLVGTEHFCLSF